MKITMNVVPILLSFACHIIFNGTSAIAVTSPVSPQQKAELKKQFDALPEKTKACVYSCVQTHKSCRSNCINAFKVREKSKKCSTKKDYKNCIAMDIQCKSSCANSHIACVQKCNPPK
jgi:hypothetical protein